METLVRRPQQARSRQTLASIVDATEALLQERPFDEVSVADIVRRAGCTTGSFYARFAAKESLLPYLYEKYDAQVSGQIEALAASDAWERMSFDEAIAALVSEMVRSYGARLHLMREIMLFARRSPEAISPEIRQRRQGLHAAINGRLESYGRRITHPDPARAIAFAVFAVSAVAREMVLFSHAPFAQSSPLAGEALVRELTRLAVAYLTAPAETVG
jgi:AcrR family transcriptional regulator